MKFSLRSFAFLYHSSPSSISPSVKYYKSSINNQRLFTFYTKRKIKIQMDNEESQSKILLKDAIDKIQSQSYCRGYHSVIMLSVISSSTLLDFNTLIYLHDVQAYKLSLMGYNFYDLVCLDWCQSSSEFCACSESEFWIDCIDIERNMKWFIANWIQISNSLIQNLTNTQLSNMIHRETFHIVFLQIYPFIRVDLPYTNIYYIFKWDKVLKPIEPWEAACETSSMCDRVSMIITIWTLKGIDEIRVSINPNNLQIFIVRIKSVKSGCAY